MTKLAEMGKKVVDFLKEKFPKISKIANLDIKEIRKKARKYFFLAKNKSIDVKREIFKDLHQAVKREVRKVIGYCQTLSESQIAQLPWNIKRSYDKVMNDGWRYLLDVAHFIRTQTIKPGKILSLHIKNVKCIVKGKIGKEFEFGRVFQLGRIKGNFIFVLESMSLEMNDKLSFIPLIEEHTRIFGEKALETVAADKGYWSAKNRRELRQRGLPACGLQKPSTIKEEANVDLNRQERLHNRRAGIEPLIGHVTIGTKQNEKRQGNFSLRLWLCPGFQYASTDQISTRKNKTSFLKKKEKEQKVDKKEMGKSVGDPSVAEAPSGYGFGAFAPKPNYSDIFFIPYD